MPTIPATPTRTPADSVDVAERARVAVLAVTDRIGYPHRGIAARLGVLLRDLVTLRAYGVNEAEMRLVSVAVDGVIDDLCHPVTPDMERVVARHESDADRKEDAIADLRLIEGDSPMLMDEHAKALEIDAASARTYARVLRHRARQLRGTGEAARARLGLAAQGHREQAS